MISQDDIAAFAEQNQADIAAAREFVRRAEKGLKSDRWADGSNGDKAVARGIKAQAIMYEMAITAFLTLWHEKQGATRLYSKDSKYFEADA